MKYYKTNIGGSEDIVAMNSETLDAVFSSLSDGQGWLLEGYFIEEVSLSDEEFITACKNCDKFASHHQKRNGYSPFTEQEEWDGATPALEIFNLSTENWVEVYGPCQ